MTELPTQRQLVLPLLDVLDDASAGLGTRAIAEAVAERMALPAPLRDARIEISGQSRSHFRHRLRWAQQLAKFDGLVERDEGRWRITRKGRDSLTRATPGQVVTVFTTDSGAFLWGLAEDAIGHVEDGSVAAVWTSPPYPLLTQKRYGDPMAAGEGYVDWLTRMVEGWLPKLDGDDASVLLNLGDAWMPGMPSISTYQERLVVRLEDRLGLRLAQRFTWWNTSALPGPTLWTCIRKVRVKQAAETIWWLSRSGHARGDNQRVLVPYADDRPAAVGPRVLRPSGHRMRGHAFERDNGGSIPSNVLPIAHGSQDRAYFRACREAGLPVHPARFPADLARFFIGLATEEGETVLDPFGGSGTTGRIAEEMGRRWICFEAMREYAEGARLRFAA
jgi:site-specific DNA-methyltransferase (cytosine-N4-specific)